MFKYFLNLACDIINSILRIMVSLISILRATHPSTSVRQELVRHFSSTDNLDIHSRTSLSQSPICSQTSPSLADGIPDIFES